MSHDVGRARTMNLGHVAAWGAIVAGQLTESRMRYTQMTQDHIVFSPADNRVRVVGGGSGIVPIAWPSEARRHHDDIALFRSEFGTGLTSALRLGYIYRLGPIGEWIFFEPDDSTLVLGPPTGHWSEEWDAPGEELRLGNDCSLSSSEMSQILVRGVTFQKERDLVGAKRCFMRCYLAAIATANEMAMAVALGNLATTYRDELRWIRVLALGVSAGYVASTLPDDAKDWIGAIVNEARRHEPAATDRMRSYSMDPARIGESFTEILWRLEDSTIQEELARMKPATGQ
jgi:hypothetical protein